MYKTIPFLDPLTLPEIVYHIGEFIPIWTSNSHGVKEFTPTDLIACTNVCHLWNVTLTPLLGSVYDQEAMAPWAIPVSTTEAWSYHFQSAVLFTCFAPCLFHCTKLQDLVLLNSSPLQSSSLRWAEVQCALVRANPQLTRLCWTYATVPQDKLATLSSLVFGALDALVHLEALKLDGWPNLDPARLHQVLFNNSKLKRLVLSRVTSLEPLPTSEVLHNLTELVLESDLDANEGVPSLPQICPNLALITLCPDLGIASEVLSACLKIYCPKLSSLSTAQHLRLEDDGLSRISSIRYGTLIAAIKRLENLDIAISKPLSHISRAIYSYHADWIRTIYVTVMNPSRRDFIGACELLTTCRNLESFAMINHAGQWDPDDILNLSDDEEPWTLRVFIILISVRHPSVSSTYMAG
ncbi:hypothetical protein BG004_008352 [Podila humilis]|nr:hypothetical protein BG004_008352 [Podila humilis]